MVAAPLQQLVASLAFRDGRKQEEDDSWGSTTCHNVPEPIRTIFRVGSLYKEPYVKFTGALQEKIVLAG